jgi:hypothetical protein
MERITCSDGDGTSYDHIIIDQLHGSRPSVFPERLNTFVSFDCCGVTDAGHMVLNALQVQAHPQLR